MKKIISIILLGSCLLHYRALAIENAAVKQIKITITGIGNYQEFQEITGGIKKIAGVSDLIPATLSRNVAILTGRLVSNAGVFKNDMQVLVMDRFKFSSKDREEAIEITLKKL